MIPLLLRLIACISMTVNPPAIQRVIDGDTFVLYAVGVPAEEHIRVLGVNAVEIKDTLGPAAKAFTAEWLGRGPFTLSACKRDSFGRLLGSVVRGTDTLAVDIIAAKLGVKYP